MVTLSLQCSLGWGGGGDCVIYDLFDSGRVSCEALGMNELNKAFIHFSVTPWHVSVFAINISDISFVPHTSPQGPPADVHLSCSTEKWPHFVSETSCLCGRDCWFSFTICCLCL